jgi:perosamine synthetase
VGLRAALPPHVHIVEDAAHALGARYAEGGPVGSSGNLVCFSFYANKNLSTAEGGAIALFDPKVAERLRSLRQNAMPADAWKRFTHASTIIAVGPSEIGYKLNYTDLQACIGRVQLRRQEIFAARRIEIARVYMDRLRGALGADGFQEGLDAGSHARHLFVVKVPIEKSRSRDAVLGKLRERNIGATVHYMPLHQMPFYRVQELSLPETEWLAPRLLTLPIGSAMTTADAEYVCGHLLELLGHD